MDWETVGILSSFVVGLFLVGGVLRWAVDKDKRWVLVLLLLAAGGLGKMAYRAGGSRGFMVLLVLFGIVGFAAAVWPAVMRKLRPVAMASKGAAILASEKVSSRMGELVEIGESHGKKETPKSS